MPNIDHSKKPLFSVCYFGSDPDLDNDDCWYGSDFATRADVEKEYAKPCSDALPASVYLRDRDVEYVVLMELTGTDSLGRPEYMVLKKRLNPHFKPRRPTIDPEADWRREIAMEAGMLYGCDAYNETMGY